MLLFFALTFLLITDFILIVYISELLGRVNILEEQMVELMYGGKRRENTNRR